MLGETLGLVAEMTNAGEDHRGVCFVRRGDNLVVAHRAAGLNHRGDPRCCRGVDSVAEGAEGVGGHD